MVPGEATPPTLRLELCFHRSVSATLATRYLVQGLLRHWLLGGNSLKCHPNRDDTGLAYFTEAQTDAPAAPHEPSPTKAISTAVWREDGMAVIVKYVVVSDGKDDMIFSTRKEAEAHDKMLDIAERLYAFLHVADLNMAEDTLEALTLFMAQHRTSIGTILKGGRLKTPDNSTQRAALPQDKREEASASEHKSNKASQGALTTKPKAAA
jgi:dsDNA-binding SOS-regulon protein